MNVRRFLLIAASTALLSSGAVCSTSLFAQDPFAIDDDAGDRVHLFDSLEKPVAATDKSTASSSDVRKSRMSVAELRQARALYRANQRVARLEHNLWMRYEPLRPNWNSVPMMSSRYTNRQLYVPVYIRN